MSESQQKGAWFADAVEQLWPFGQLDEQFLKKIVGVGFTAGEIQEERKQCLGMIIVQAFEIEGRRHVFAE